MNNQYRILLESDGAGSRDFSLGEVDASEMVWRFGGLGPLHQAAKIS